MSLPSDHAPTTVTMRPPSLNLDCLFDRASGLGGHGVLDSLLESRLMEKPIRIDAINPERFTVALFRGPLSH